MVAMILNLPPRMRTGFGALLLLGVMPPHIQNYAVMFQFLLRQMAPALGGEGIDVWDASIKKWIKLVIEIVAIVEDSKGLHHPLGSKQAPAIVGGCPFCTVVGVRGQGTTVYISAISKLSQRRNQQQSQRNAEIRDMFMDSFRDWPEVLQKAEQPAPGPMTMRAALRSAARSMQGLFKS